MIRNHLVKLPLDLRFSLNHLMENFEKIPETIRRIQFNTISSATSLHQGLNISYSLCALEDAKGV